MAKKKKAKRRQKARLWVCRDVRKVKGVAGYVVYFGPKPTRAENYGQDEWDVCLYGGQCEVPSNEMYRAYGFPYLRPGAGPVDVTR